MAAPTVAVTVKLSAMDGTAYANTVITAKLDINDVYDGFVISDEVTGTTNASGIAVLNLFPNNPTTGLGTTGSVYTFTARPTGGKPWKVTAQIPNQACDLEDFADLEVTDGLGAARTAQSHAQSSAAASAASATASAASAAASATSATASATSATASATSATAAGTQATNSATSATNSASSAAAAAASAVAADASADAALASEAATAGMLVSHTGDPTDAHAASAITNTPAGTIAATTVQAAINELAGDHAAHLADAADAHAASAVTNTPAGTIAATTVQAAINELDGDHTAHLADAADAHAASAITNTPSGGIAATTVQAAINELDTEKATVTALNDHIGDATAAHAASAVSVTPAGSIAATTVQAALEEVDSDVTSLSDALQFADYVVLRAYAGSRKAVYISGYLVSAAPSGISGLFTRDDSDTTSADNGGTIIVASNGKRWKRCYSGPISVRWFGASPIAAAAANLTAIQAAIDFAYALGSGDVELPELYPVNATVDVPQRVFLVGPSGGFVNQYVSVEAAAKGAGLFLATGSNVDLVRFRCRLYNDAGVLKETTHAVRNSEARHFGGARNIALWGNRSTNQDPSTTDLNSTGDGAKIEGSRYVTLENVTTMFCAGDGVEMASHDYGTGAITSNNANLIRPNSLSNAGHGMRLAGGDNTVVAPNCGNNAANGILWSTSGSLTGGLTWNNGKYGFESAGTTNTSSSAINGLLAYDNDETGFRVGTGRAPTLNGCVGRGNGRDTGAAATDRSNFLLSTGAEGWSFAGCRSYARDQDDALVTQYGFYINNTTYSGTLDGCTDEGSATPSFIADGTKIIAHVGTTSIIDHPGMRLLGNLDVNQKTLSGVRGLRFDRWNTLTTITSNAITISTDALIALNCTGVQTVNDLTYASTGIPLVVLRNISADAVTFTHDTAKLRCANGASVVLAQHESVSFLWVSGTVWQEFGGAY